MNYSNQKNFNLATKNQFSSVKLTKTFIKDTVKQEASCSAD